jgi:hypothetical protein
MENYETLQKIGEGYVRVGANWVLGKGCTVWAHGDGAVALGGFRFFLGGGSVGRHGPLDPRTSSAERRPAYSLTAACTGICMCGAQFTSLLAVRWGCGRRAGGVRGWLAGCGLWGSAPPACPSNVRARV